MDLSHNLPPAAGWLQQARLRALKWWPAKMIGMTLIMTLFFIAYFWVLKHAFSTVTTMPYTAIDRLITFQPEPCRSICHYGFTCLWRPRC
jgi:hypothetical protein